MADPWRCVWCLGTMHACELCRVAGVTTDYPATCPGYEMCGGTEKRSRRERRERTEETR